MTVFTWAGILLASGFLVFLTGAVRWRLAYEQPIEAALPLIQADRRRRAWIHLRMIVAMFLTPAGLVGLPFALEPTSPPGWQPSQPCSTPSARRVSSPPWPSS